ncbi:MAG: hypothetical protein IJ794_00970 [Lachnospiraceae bacterium]|nr:hypothetical protein [Lachnospiraceae bacterium]
MIHLRKGKFGKLEQHSERKLQDYLTELQNYALGLMIPVAYFTRRKSGLVDTERINQTVRLMTADCEELQESDDVKQFYSSFLYCALALMSVEFDWIPYADPLGFHHASFPGNLQMNFLDLITDADLRGAEKNDDMNSEYDLGLTDGIFFLYLPILYHILTGENIVLPYVPLEPPEMTRAEYREFMEDNAEWISQIPDESEEERAMEDAYYKAQDTFTPMTDEEYIEAHKSLGEKVKAIYPGYADYIQNLERFAELFQTCASKDFNHIIRKLVTEFLLSQGYSLYNKEDDYIEVMVALNAARKKVMEAMRYER